MGQILSYPADTSPATGDKFLFQDGSTNATKYMTYGTLKDSIAGAAWQSWTPSWSNLTVGNGTVISKYIQTGKAITARVYFKLGSTSSVGTDVIFTLPVNANGDYVTATAYVGTCYLEDAAVSGWCGFARIISATQCVPCVALTSGSYAQNSGLTASVPFTWGTNDFFALTIKYEGV